MTIYDHIWPYESIWYTNYAHITHVCIYIEWHVYIIVIFHSTRDDRWIEAPVKDVPLVTGLATVIPFEMVVCKKSNNSFTSCDPHPGIFPEIYYDILFDIFSDILSSMLPGLLSDILSDIYFDILSGIRSGILFDILIHFILHIFWHSIWHIFWHSIWDSTWHFI